MIKKQASANDRTILMLGLALLCQTLCHAYAQENANSDTSNPVSNSTNNVSDTETQKSEKSEKDLFDEAASLMKLNENRKAEDILATLSKNNNVSVLTNYGIVLIRLGKIKSALETLSQANTLAPQSQATLFYLRQALRAQGELDREIDVTAKFLTDLKEQKNTSSNRAGTSNNQIARLEEELKKLHKERDWKRSLAEKTKDDYLQEASSPAVWTKDLMPIKIYIEEGPDEKQLKDAFRDWASASDNKLKIEFVPEIANAQIQCKWTKDSSTLSSPLEGGETLVSKSADGKMQSAKIQILLSEDQLERKAAELHEAGHSLGLGHSTRPGDAMFFAFNRDAFNGELSKRDKRTIKNLYSSSREELAQIREINQDQLEHAESNSPLQSAINLNKKAALLFASGDSSRAVELLEKADSLAPNTKTIQVNLASAYLRLADQECENQSFVAAEKHLNLAAINFAKAKRIEDAKSVYRDLANMAKGMNRAAEAASYLQKEQELSAGSEPKNSPSSP